MYLYPKRRSFRSIGKQGRSDRIRDVIFSKHPMHAIITQSEKRIFPAFGI